MSLRSNRFPVQGALHNLRQHTGAVQSESATVSLNKTTDKSVETQITEGLEKCWSVGAIEGNNSY